MPETPRKTNHYLVQTYTKDTEDAATNDVIFDVATHAGREKLMKHLGWATINGHDIEMSKVEK